MVKCKAKDCEKEGTEKVEYSLLGGLRTEYYCETHYEEIKILVNVLETVSKNRGL